MKIVARHAHRPRAHVAIGRVVAPPHHDARFPETLAAQIPGRAHLDPEGLGFVRARDDAAVIVREHHDGIDPQVVHTAFLEIDEYRAIVDGNRGAEFYEDI